MSPSRSPVVVAGIVALVLATTPPDGTAQGADRGQPRGSLFIVGGGEQTDDMVRRFVTLASRQRPARIAVIPLASGEPASTGAEKAEQLRAFGAEAVVWTPSRADAGDPAWVRRLDSVSAIWFTGGDQVRITEAIGGTPFAAALVARYRSGLVVGGTSAGAAIMADSMFTGRQRTADSLGYYGDSFPTLTATTIEIVPGLGFLSGVLVDQHFVRRERHNRLLSAVLERPSMIGAGIDEGTALEVGPRGDWTVLGVGTVSIYDARRATISPGPAGLLGATGMALHVLKAGSRFDPAARRTPLDP